MYSIPIMRPRLPSADRLAPYLKLMDASRVYSNFGPLVVALEDRLAERYDLNQGTVATVANATVGLAIALAVQQPPPGTLCVMPAWTFIASAHAAVMAGLVPYFVDVDPDTWALDPHKLLDVINRTPSPVGAVMPVMPFGSRLDMAAWESFRSRTQLAVVLDAAAGFDALVPSSIPAVVSLHATKARWGAHQNAHRRASAMMVKWSARCALWCTAHESPNPRTITIRQQLQPKKPIQYGQN